MKIGLYFGSFNPIHTGHLIVANTVLNCTNISKIWFIVSPQNPLKKISDLLDGSARLHLVKRATELDERMFVSDAEFNLPTPSYTYNTLKYFEDEFPENDFTLIMGSDSFSQLNLWKNYKEILQKKIIVYQRPEFVIPAKLILPNIVIINTPLLNISATEIRILIKAGKSIRYLVPAAVIEEIERNNYYR